ncbi:MAG: SH3 domain-containing protein [Lachnospiraceae bacterium]|nr:SH3 domain-containing protein [Lachnospiraceae bacterium]
MRIQCNQEQKQAGRRRFVRGVSAVIAAAMLWGTPFVSLADSTGTVIVESAKIRGSADTNSNAVGSITKGKTVTIRDEVKDAAGTLWYQVYVDANTLGYVRADLINKEGGDSSTASDSSAGGADSAGAGEEAAGSGQTASGQAENAMEAQYATVSVQAAKIRSGPSTNDGVVESLQNGTQVVVSGQSGGSDGKVWYYVTFTGADNAEKTGFVRSDLITLGDMVPVPEEEPAPEENIEPEPEETVRQDYEVAYKDGAWYLIDNVAGYEQELQPLLDAGKQQGDTEDADTKKLVKQRIAIVVLGALAAVLLVIVIIMAIKLRDAYYEDYEDDEDDEDEDEEEETADEEEDVPVRRRSRAEENTARENERPSRRPVREAETPSRRPARERETLKEPEVSQRVKPAANRKSKNFLLDDDEFEFEFLNMDDTFN